MPSRRLYDVLYRVGAPWEGEPRAELVELVTSGLLTPATLPPGRAVDLGCGSGANAMFLAQQGFDVVGVDFSDVALRKAGRRAIAAGVDGRVRFVNADLTADAIPGVPGPFDLLVDYGTLDDLAPPDRGRMVALATRLARPGARFLLWCFYARRRDLPRISFTGPSRASGSIEPGELERLFGAAFGIEPVRVGPGPFGCFLLTRSG